MTFRETAVAAGVVDQLRLGWQALTAVDRNRLSCTPPGALRGSVFLEEAVDGGRWDYGIGISIDRNENVVWLEVHPASSTGNIGEIEAKLTWLNGWLGSDGRVFASLEGVKVWLASGRCKFASGDPRMRNLRAKGVQFHAGKLELTSLF